MGRRREFQLHSIDQVDRHEAVRDGIERLMRERRFQVGDRLPSERQLAETLGVSRVVVREALKVLEALGRVEIRQGSGSYVLDAQGDPVAAAILAGSTLNLDFIRHLVDLRAAVDVKVAQLAAERATATDLAKLRRVLSQLEAEQAGSPCSASLSLVFESALAQIARSPVLAANQRSVHRAWVEAWTAVGMAPGPKPAFHHEHVAIFGAIASHDPDQAGRMMAAHVGREITAGVPEEAGGYDAVPGTGGKAEAFPAPPCG